MEEKQFTLFVLTMAIGLTVVLGRCSPTPISSEAMSTTPETVVESFYNWYAGYPGNLLVDGAYRSSEYLTEEFIQKVDGILASFDGGGYDPFLCAQDIPGEFTVEKAVILGMEASVWVVHEIWNFDTRYQLLDDLEIRLRLVDGQWKIADVICLVCVPKSAPRSPQAIATTVLLTPLAATATPSSVLPEPALIRYSNPTLGFAVDYPYDWEVTGPMNQVDPLGRSWSVIEFTSNLYGYGHQAFGKYAVTVAVGESMGRTLTETVAYSLSPIVPQFREEIKSHCCLTVGGEPAMEVLGFPLTRWGSRQVVVIHDGREYRLTFYPQRTLDGVTSSDATARAAFDAFLRTFTLKSGHVTKPQKSSQQVHQGSR